MNVCLEVEIPSFRGRSIDYIYSKFIRLVWRKQDLERTFYEGLTSGCRTKEEKGLTFSYFDDRFYLLYIFDEKEDLEVLDNRRGEMERLLSDHSLKYNIFQITTIEI